MRRVGTARRTESSCKAVKTGAAAVDLAGYRDAFDIFPYKLRPGYVLRAKLKLS